MKGVTAEESASAFERSDKRAVHPDCCDHVFGTGRIKTAAPREKRRKEKLIEPEQTDKGFAEDQIKGLINHLFL
jgi:hypothetical protein